MPVSQPHGAPPGLSRLLRSALQRDDERGLSSLAGANPENTADRLSCLREIYRLHLSPLEDLGHSARWQHHPAVAAIKRRCEGEWIAELDAATAVDADDLDVGSELRRLAARDRLPPLYRWLVREATREQLHQFLAWEGGPDGGFDDLVALCQVGLSGPAKVELARNYWDEMGNGNASDVHTHLHDRLASALRLAPEAAAPEPISALARSCLAGLLATNRWLQPEMLGALGLIELQAGPRCRLVLRAFDRHSVPRDAYPFYEVHAEVDPRHGADWVDNAITPLVDAHPDWSPRILRGARWRSSTNAAFFDEIAVLLRRNSPDVSRSAA